MSTLVSLGAIGAAILAALWPSIKLPTRPETTSGLSASARADWVNRLFRLASDADAASEPEVADRARALIASLVGAQAAPGKAK